MKKIEIINNLKNLYKNNELYTSLILQSNNNEITDEIVSETIRFMFCNNKSESNDDCINCRKASNNNLVDVLFIGDGSNSIKKESIKEMMAKMSLSAFEANGNKIYVIKNVENLKNDAANTLLKFLEEPPANTYAFLITKDRTMIIPTIKSRSKTMIVSDELKTETNMFDIFIKTKNKDTYFLATNKLKKIDKKELITMIEDSLRNTIMTKEFINISKQTMELIEDLKYSINTTLSLDIYFIKIAKEL